MPETAAKKPNIFVRMGQGIAKFFRDVKAEIKKIIWPTPKRIAKDTAIVLVSVLIVGVFIWILSFLFHQGVLLIVGA